MPHYLAIGSGDFFVGDIMSRHEDFGKYLADTYPNIFTEPLWISCNEGWHDLIDDLSRKISEAADRFPHRSVTVVQIKEKFGGLRYYLNYEDMNDDSIHVIEKIVRDTESKSYKICEDCSGEADICSPKHYWMKTLCMNCRSKYDMGDTPNGI